MKTVAIQSDWSPITLTVLRTLLDDNHIIVPLSRAEKDVYGKLQEAQVEAVYDMDENKFKKTGIEATHPLLTDFHGPGFVLFSSGTTGPPKAALHDFNRFLERFKGPGKALRTILFYGIDHIAGWDVTFYCLRHGGEPIYLWQRTPDEICYAVQEYSAELLPTTPTFLNMILFSRMYEKYDLSSLKVITYGSESMPQTTLEAITEVLPNVRLKQTYGLTELGTLTTQSERSDSLWVKVGGETKVVDGVLWVKSETSMLGYLNAPSPFEDGWYCTGDRVEEQRAWDTAKLQPAATGYIRFLGRDSEIINVGGEKVYPAQVESCILELHGVKDVVVKGIPNALMGSTILARVYAEGDRDALRKRIIKHCRARIGKYKTPTRVEFVDNPMVTERYKRAR